MRRLLRFIIKIVLVIAVVVIAIGSYIGNVAYTEFREAPWDSLLGIENHAKDVSVIDHWEEERGWEKVWVTDPDGTRLRGTYIENSEPTDQTVILLHGLYQNRSMCLPYISIYRNLGYNVLLIDLRGHGESGGSHTDWGLSEQGDMDAWIQFLREKNEHMQIGLHGISLGAAMSLLYVGGDHGKNISFVVADSSYGNIIALGQEKLREAQADKWTIRGYKVLDPFFQGAMYYHTRKLVSDIEPAQAVKHITVPVLFLHGSDDELVPVKTAKSLYDNCQSKDKDIYVFGHSGHAVGIATNKQEYINVVTGFLHHANS